MKFLKKMKNVKKYYLMLDKKIINELNIYKKSKLLNK